MDLKEIRNEIDKIDSNLAYLLEKRFQLTDDVAKFKKNNNVQILHEDRENAILHNISTLTNGNQDVLTAFKNLLAQSKEKQSSLISDKFTINSTNHQKKYVDQKDVNVGFLGDIGAYSHQASLHFFKSANLLPFSSIACLCEEYAKSDNLNYIVLPIDNSNAGTVLETYNALKEYSFFIVDSFKLALSHSLLSTSKNIDTVKTVLSHTQALQQCDGFLNSINAKTCETFSTVDACKQICQKQDISLGAIASSICGKIYGLNVLNENISLNSFNQTKFVVISKKPNVCKTNSVVSIIATLENKPASLGSLLSSFSYNGINLTKIQSRPLHGSDFEYIFYLDFEGNIEDNKISKLLTKLSTTLPYFKFLGNY